MILKSKSIHSSLITHYFLLILVISGFLTVVSCNVIRKQVIQGVSTDLKNNCLIFKDIIYEDLLLKNNEGLQKNADKIQRELDIRVTIIGADGIVLSDSEEKYSLMDNHIDRDEIEAAIKTGYGQSVRYSQTIKMDFLYVAVAIKNGSSPVGFIRMSVPLVTTKKAMEALINQIIFITIVLLLLSIFAVHKISLKFTDPINEISKAARRVAGGDFSVRLYNNDETEMRELVANFNDMTIRLNDLFTQVNSEKEQAESIISSIGEGILVISSDGIITELNNSFVDILDVRENIEGRYFWEVLRNPDIVKQIKRSGAEKVNIVNEIYYNGKILICSSNYIKTKNEKVLIVSDITKLKTLEQLKKDFVANVSHELRTPLTAIKGFIETLMEDNAVNDNNNYLEIVSRHTDRMINIVNDLLLLSEIEQKDGGLAVEKVNLEKVCKNIRNMFSEKLSLKNLTFDISVTGDPIIAADSFKIEQMFINLIDNAIKYTDHGGLVVNIKGSNGTVDIDFIDTGIGINLSAIDPDRLFERFFVVDKSRSRKTGGTGLGLSIVKHIVLLHKGKIKVKSQPGIGTTFFVSMPSGVVL